MSSSSRRAPRLRLRWSRVSIAEPRTQTALRRRSIGVLRVSYALTARHVTTRTFALPMTRPDGICRERIVHSVAASLLALKSGFRIFRRSRSHHISCSWPPRTSTHCARATAVCAACGGGTLESITIPSKSARHPIPAVIGWLCSASPAELIDRIDLALHSSPCAGRERFQAKGAIFYTAVHDAATTSPTRAAHVRRCSCFPDRARRSRDARRLCLSSFRPLVDRGSRRRASDLPVIAPSVLATRQLASSTMTNGGRWPSSRSICRAARSWGWSPILRSATSSSTWVSGPIGSSGTATASTPRSSPRESVRSIAAGCFACAGNSPSWRSPCRRRRRPRRSPRSASSIATRWRGSRAITISCTCR